MDQNIMIRDVIITMELSHYTLKILDKDTPTYSSTNYNSGGTSNHEEL